jgi:ABC-type sugar transport system substrate-binding protein
MTINKARIVVSLPGANAYFREQAILARSAGEKMGFAMEVLHASDAINQSQQLLGIIHSRAERRPDAFIVEPLTGAGLRRVAQAAVAEGIAWVISNCDVDYIQQLRKSPETPVFAVTQGQMEIGRLQGRQLAALLRGEASVLYIQGSSASSVAIQRREGMEATKPKNARITMVRSAWSQEDACRAVSAWLRLATSRAEKFDLIAGQTHELVLGARNAFEGLVNSDQQRKWLSLPCVGVGIARQVQPLVSKGILTAAVVTSLTMEVALHILADAFRTKVQPPECALVEASSYPSLEDLHRVEKRDAEIQAATKPLQPTPAA